MLDSFSFRGFRSETNEVILSCIVVPDSLAIAAKDKDLIVGSSDNRGKALGRTVKPCNFKGCYVNRTRAAYKCPKTLIAN